MFDSWYLEIVLKWTICMHNHFGIEIFCPNRDVVYILYWLTDMVVIVLLEAMSDNRELSRVFHHIISSDFKVIASAFLYCIRSSRYF